jgi:secreted protein with Ig-like and vWFA domain
MNGAKLDLAKQAARVVLKSLSNDEWFGVVTFNAQFDWPVPLQPVQDRDSILRGIDKISAVGETNIYPALADAYGELAKIGATRKHIILLTDGRSLPGDYQTLARQMEPSHITVSTVGLGGGADLQLLDDIANGGHGRSYFIQDPEKLPELFSREIELLKQ